MAARMLAIFLIFYAAQLWAQQPPVIYFAPLAQAYIGKNVPTALFVPTDLSKIPQVQEGGNRLYDFSKVAVKPTQNGSPTEPYTSRAFPSATHITRNVMEFLNLFDTIAFEEVLSLTNNYFGTLGIHVPKTNFPLSGITFEPKDSLNFPEQDFVFSSPFKKIAFPCTENTPIQPKTTIQRDLKATIYYDKLNIKNDKLTRRTYDTRSDTVVGWGKIKLPLLNKEVEVLMVKAYSTVVDSFIYKDSTYTKLLVYGLGAKQGRVTTSSKILFYTPSALLPVLRLNFAGHDFKVITGAIFDLGAVITATEAVQPDIFRCYPNPIAQNQVLYIENEANKNNVVEIFDLTGNLVKRAFLPLNEKNTLQLDMQKGMYFLRMQEQVKKLWIE
jgi:Secretion system C-terminal sorting domain